MFYYLDLGLYLDYVGWPLPVRAGGEGEAGEIVAKDGNVQAKVGFSVKDLYKQEQTLFKRSAAGFDKV